MDKNELEKIKKNIGFSAFVKPDWQDIRYEEDHIGINSHFVVNDRKNSRVIKMSGLKLNDLLMLQHLHGDIECLLKILVIFFDKEKSKDFLCSSIESDAFQNIRFRDEFASAAPWKFSLEGRDHFGGDSVIVASDGENIYISGISDLEQDSLCELRNVLSNLISVFVSVCGSKYKI